MKTSSIIITLKQEEDKLNEKTPLIRSPSGNKDLKVEINIFSGRDKDSDFHYESLEEVRKRMSAIEDKQETSKDKKCCLIM